MQFLHAANEYSDQTVLMCQLTLEVVSSVANFITAYEESQ